MSLTAKVCLLLSEWISFLLAAVPPRSHQTFVELLIGCMLNPEGWVTRAIGAIRREAHWTTYYMLIDAWFMRKSLILPLLEQKVRIIGQVRRDTALYLPPEPEPIRRGPKRKYGRRIDAAMLDTLSAQERVLILYGKMQRVRLRSVIAVARFLKGVPVRAVWCEMRQDDNTWSRPRLILATETELSAQAVVEIYAERWGIEPLFHNLKRWWGVTNLWQQSKAALELWMQIRSTAYALTQVLALKLWESFPLMEIAPWRKGAMITAGLFGQWMRIQFIGLRVRDACNPKSGNFVMPFPGQDQRLQC